MSPQRKKLSNPWIDSVDFKLRAFPDPDNWYGGLQCILHSAADAQKVFDDFVERLTDAMGRRYFPVYRMADGEFLFCLGWRAPLAENPDRFDWWKNLRPGLREKLHELRGFGTLWGENYSLSETLQGRRKLPAMVREIARDGALGLYFMRRGDLWGEQFIFPMLKWFRKNNIEFSNQNYIPFYMVYAALTGPMRQDLFADRRILVATGASPTRQEGIRQGLEKIGASDVEFIDVSADKSMFSKVDLSTISNSPDIALVGAGVGSANVIIQLKKLAVPIIDAGIFLECLIDPRHCKQRPFLCPERTL